MRITSEHVDKTGKIIVDSLLLLLFFSMLLIPISSVSLLKIKSTEKEPVVLSEQNVRVEPDTIRPAQVQYGVPAINDMPTPEETTGSGVIFAPPDSEDTYSEDISQTETN